MHMPAFYLASASPRRAELLRQIGVDFTVLPCAVDECGLGGEAPEEQVLRLALAKARAGWVQRGRILDLPVLGADTLVVLDGKVFGKPRDRADALAMLATLSGRVHAVLSAVAMGRGDEQQARLSVSHVRFRPIRHDEAERYWATGEPADKAGAYAIQGFGAVFVERLEGSYSAVMGLPLFETAELLAAFGVLPWRHG
jgi:septum formation protein